MLIEKLSLPAQGAMELAGRLAVKSDHRHLTPAHLLLALLDGKDTPAQRYLKLAKTDLDKLREQLERRLGRVARAEAGADHTPVHRSLDAVLARAEDAAAARNNKYIGPDHLLLGMLDDGELAGDLAAAGTDASELRSTLAVVRASGFAGRDRLSDYEALARYGVDLTARAREGRLDPVIGRDGEIRQIIQVLSRRLKNNPLLVGEPGVGKTAVVEGLAQRIVQGRVPDNLADHAVVSLDLGTLLAGTKFRGEFEERIKRVLEEVAEAGNVVLFFDEIHMLVGAGAVEGGTDASNLLKPALSRGELRCVGSTTLAEYRKRIEKDAAFSRRFQLVRVDEPNAELAVTILRGLKETYEAHHGVRVTDAAIHAAVKLSHRYVTDRFLPDKAIDLVDQAAASLRMEAASRPGEIEVLDERIVGAEIEVRAIEQDNDGRPTERSRALRSSLEELKKQRGGLVERWEKEKRAVLGVQEAKRELEAARREMDQRIREQDFTRVAELQYKVIPDRERRLAELGEIDVKEVRWVRREVTERDVAEAAAKLTGIPLAKLLEHETERLLQLESALSRRVLGQDEAVSAVARTVRRARAAMQDPNRPLGSFLMLGPTGVGKTELAKALAEQLFDDERALVRLDMSEYMEKHAASRLVGAPPGYVGYEEGGLLTNPVRRRPYSVVLLDEVEKAHPDVFNMLLQLLDDGRLTDSQGTTVDFKNTLVLMTSNLGAERGEAATPPSRERALQAARRFFRPELLNRLDDVLVFQPLDRARMAPIAELQIARVARLVAERGAALEVSPEAVAYLAEQGFDPAYGARPLRRTVQRELQDPIAELVLTRKLNAGSKVRVSRGDAGLKLDVV